MSRYREYQLGGHNGARDFQRRGFEGPKNSLVGRDCSGANNYRQASLFGDMDRRGMGTNARRMPQPPGFLYTQAILLRALSDKA